MNNFIMIAPEGWTLLSMDYVNQGFISESNLMGASMVTNIEVLTAAMLDRGEITPEQTIEDIKLIDDSPWVRIV